MNEQEDLFFRRFTEPDSDRYRVLWDFLIESKLSPQKIGLSHSQHILLSSHRTLNKGMQPKVLIAHYDCVAGSPGANDNGAAVLELIMTAKMLQQAQISNWYILFTDKEERKQGSTLNSQGSYYVAQGFKTIGFDRAHCYIFDACGRGNTLIFSTALDELAKGALSDAMADRIVQTRKLRTYALEVARSLSIRKVQLVPTPFSDDLGFLYAGLTAQTITLLPEDEAQILLQHRQSHGPLPAIPTWQLMNSPQDRRETLTEEGFSIIPAFAFALCASPTF
jgi:hypothetical protein